MLGPSGSGKTTCLRLISGFERPTAGHVRIFGETAEHLPPNRRTVNTVFQDYALVPAPLRPRQRRLRPDGPRRGRAERHAPPRRCSPSSSSPASATASRRSSPAASASASRSPAPSSTAPASSSSTSRSAPSTSSSARRCRMSSRRCSSASASPSSSSPTTRARRCRWPTASPSSTTAASCRSAPRRRSTSARAPASSPTSSAPPTSCRRTSPPARRPGLGEPAPRGIAAGRRRGAVEGNVRSVALPRRRHPRRHRRRRRRDLPPRAGRHRPPPTPAPRVGLAWDASALNRWRAPMAAARRAVRGGRWRLSDLFWRRPRLLLALLLGAAAFLAWDRLCRLACWRCSRRASSRSIRSADLSSTSRHSRPITGPAFALQPRHHPAHLPLMAAASDSRGGRSSPSRWPTTPPVTRAGAGRRSSTSA